MLVRETPRLRLRRVAARDADFILELLNEPDFIRFIGDKGVRTIHAARRYILDGPLASYRRHGFGLYLVELKETGAPIGICGLVKRDSLEDVDVGFAFLQRFRGQGYAFEAAAASLAHAREDLGLARVVAITAPDNEASIRLVEKLGLRFDRMVELAGIDGETRLFTPDAPP